MRSKYSRLLGINRKSSISAAISRLTAARSQVESTQYGQLLRALRAASPAAAAANGRRISRFEDLYWIRPVASLSLENEAAWASHWLMPLADRISEHAARVQSAQEAFAMADFSSLAKIADESISADGWSFWAFELKLAASAVVTDFASTKDSVLGLQKAAVNRNSGLLLQMLLDRIDPSVTSGSFRSKCNSFFGKVDHQDRSGVIRMRSTRHLTSVDQIRWIMSWNLASSYIDYYEDFLYLLDYLRMSPELGVSRSDIRELLSGVSGLAASDHRITKLSKLLDDIPDLAGACSGSLTLVDRFIDRCYKISGFEEPFFSTDPLGINEALADCEKRGAVATKSAEKLVKLGWQFSALPIAEGIQGKGLQRFYEITDEVFTPGGGALASKNITLSQIATLQPEQILAFVENSESSEAKELRNLTAAGEAAELPTIPSVLHAWAALRLIEAGRLSDADTVVDHLSSFGEPWLRVADKVRTKIEKARGNLAGAVEILVKWLLQGEEYELEFPVVETLNGTSWRDVSCINPWKIGLVANAANYLSRSSGSRYLCRKACAEFYDLLAENHVDQLISSAESKLERLAITEFIRRVWLESNLTLVSSLPSPESVRASRVQMLQHLSHFDPDREAVYRQEIQEITLDETLWRGLMELDINRVYVNESAITRWAEKEYGDEYARFQSLQSGSEIESIIHDPDIRSYLIDGDVESLKELQEAHQSFGLLLVPIFSGLFDRFMNDPTDGLNAYLSLRIRHGTLKGTLLSGAEEERILIVGMESEDAFLRKFSSVLPGDAVPDIVSTIKLFSQRIVGYVDSLVDEVVQIRSPSKPQGAFSVALNEGVLTSVLTFADPSWSFQSFASQCYAAFWKYLDPSRRALSGYLRGEFKSLCAEAYDDVLATLVETYGSLDIEQLLISLQASLTKMLAAVELASSWFLTDSASEERGYSLEVALEIAQQAMQNVFPDFDIEREDDFDGCKDLSLSALGLTVVYDSLFVVMGNVWERSGLKGQRPCVKISIVWCAETSTLYFRIANSLAEEVRSRLVAGRLEELREKYLSGCVSELFAVEGGSGFAKLSRISAGAGSKGRRLEFDVDNGNFWVAYHIQLHRRGEYFDAYL